MTAPTDKSVEELKAMVAAQGFVLMVLCPATGGIIARVLGQPFWYGAVAGGWVLAVLGARTVRRRAKMLAAYTAEAKTLSDVTVHLQQTLARVKLAEAGMPTTAVHTAPTDRTEP